jgi:glycosyltransferase involved in cell wall biosynthesis
MSSSKGIGAPGQPPAETQVGAGRICQLLVVDLEPTPYKTDLWNTFADSQAVGVQVVYTERKNWAPDGGHDYQKWPAYRHAHTVLKGQGLRGKLKAARHTFARVWREPLDLVCIAGYVHIATVAAIAAAVLRGRRFVVHADVFNIQRPTGRFGLIKWAVREGLRSLIFWRGDGVLVCGRRGIESAILAGCPRRKIVDFPYVIDVARMKRDEPQDVSPSCRRDMDRGLLVVFFSGRMIPRKGLPTLLEAMARLKSDPSWVLWIEGDGPGLEAYRQLAQTHGLSDRCHFLGFCQFDLHSWLIRHADVVVVPSLEDSWGIVVDEGLQFGKAVISSDATGSGYDRIQDGRNGLLFAAGDVAALHALVGKLIRDAEARRALGEAALAGPKNLGPADNLRALLQLWQGASSPH